MTSKNYLIISVLSMFTWALIAQENVAKAPFFSGTITSMEYVTPLSSRPNDLVPADNTPREAKDKRSIANHIVVGQDPQTEDDYFVRNRHEMEQSILSAPASLVFDAYASSSQPTDPSLAIGPNHVFVVYNTGFRIFDKSGNPLTGQIAPSPAIFPNGGCCDLTVSYDNAADRWVVSFLSINNGAQIAVSDGSDPVNAGWNVYTISAIQDYQKLSVWSDGYYITENTSGASKVWALERSAMLAGSTSAKILGFDLPGIATSGFFSPQVLNITDDNFPAAGGATVIYLQDDAWSGVSEDHLKLWTIDVDWVNTANSSVSAAQQFPTTPFISVFDNGSYNNLRQPGQGRPIYIDALQAIIMNQAQFRKFSTHNSAVFNFVVDTDASSEKLAGVRWYEFRQPNDNGPWTLFQEGTYTAPDGRHAWNASLAMDGQGNIGMGYTSMSGPNTPGTVYVSSYFTGRGSGDPLGTMTVMEELIANGNGKIPGIRYGDYSKIDVDPSDDSTFWFINEYINGNRRGVVGRFQIQTAPPDVEAPSIPTNLAANNITHNSATLTWTESTDNVGVDHYNIFIDGVTVGTATTASFDVTGLDPVTLYTATVNAEDAAGNTSGEASVQFTTLEMVIDTDPPSDPTNLVATNITADSATLTWTGSTDNIAVDHYNISIDGNVVGTSNTTSFDVVGLSPITLYTAEVNAEDAAGNVSGNASTQFTTLEGGTSGEIAAYYFETGMDDWIDGGKDCQRQATSNSYEGLYSIKLRNGSSTSFATSPALDLTGISQINIEFHTYASGMDNGDSFVVEFFNGSTYELLNEYAYGTDFTNDSFYGDTISVDAATYNFNTNNRIRIRNTSNSNNDNIWFDQVIITGGGGFAPLAHGTGISPDAIRAQDLATTDHIRLFPNPANTSLNIEILNEKYDEITIFSTNGNLVKTIDEVENNMTIDVSQFTSGVYFVRFVTGKFAVTKRFVKN